MPSGVHDSALIVNAFRAALAPISADPYAALWFSSQSRQWAQACADKVGASEVLVHALRHRFFLDSLHEFLRVAPDGVLINVGAGFTNYPQLLPPHVPCCELDKPITLALKRQKLAAWEAAGQLPARATTFLPVDDLNDPDELTALARVLQEWVGGRPSFVLLEGVFFYLTPPAIAHLHAVLGRIQRRGDWIASTAFRPEEARKAIFQRLVRYCRTDYGLEAFTPTTLPAAFYRQQPGYALRRQVNYAELHSLYAPGEHLGGPQEVLEEDAYILERT